MLKHVRNNGTSHWRTLFYLIGITLYVYYENIPEKKVFHCFHTDHAHFFVWNGKFWSLKNGEIAVWIYRVFILYFKYRTALLVCKCSTYIETNKRNFISFLGLFSS